MAEPALARGEPDYYYTDMPVGEILRRAREHYRQTIPDIENALRIRASQIEAIEKGDMSKLPGPVYAVGFVRSYAEYLGLSGDKMVRLFKLQTADIDKKPELHFPAAAAEKKMPPLWLAGVSLALAFAMMAAWGIYHREDRTVVTSVPAVPIEMRESIAREPIPQDTTGLSAYMPLPEAEHFKTQIPAEGLAETAPAEAAPAEAAEPADSAPATYDPAPVQQAEPGIILDITENSWVEIMDGSGKAIVSRVLKKGDRYFVPDRPDLTMSIGNAGGVMLLIDGEPIAPLGASGEVRRNIPLDSSALKAAN